MKVFKEQLYGIFQILKEYMTHHPHKERKKKLRTPNLIPQNMQEAVKLRTQNKKDNPQILNLVMVKN